MNFPDHRIILVDEQSAFIIKQAIHKLNAMERGPRTNAFCKVQCRAVDIMCKNMDQFHLSTADYCDNPRYFLNMELRGDMCVVQDVDGQEWLMLGI